MNKRLDAYDRYDRSIGGRFRSGKRVAKKRNLEWNLTLDEFSKILASNKCHYCEGELNKKGSGLDRLNNDLGYILGNVVACCWRCNEFKGKNLNWKEASFLIKILKLVRELGIL